MTESKSLTLLLRCLRGRGIAANNEELQKALVTEHNAAIDAWINEYLVPETLLTKDELFLYSALQKSGEIEVLTSSQEILLMRGVDDQEIESAIEELQRSTAAIEKQTETLRIQREAMATFRERNRQNHEARAAADNAQYRMWITENNHVTSVVDELLQSLTYRITELELQCKAPDAELRKTASEILRMDDKLLSSLQKLASGLDPGQAKDNDKGQRVQDLCARLIKYMVEGVRSRLDRVYLEAVKLGGDSREIPVEDDAEVKALRDELESLYSEILPVAQMSAEQQYLEPALRSIAAQDAHGKDRSRKALDYISKCLSVLIDRLQTFTARTGEYRNHRTATMLLIKAAKSELDSNVPQSSTKPKPSSPTRPRKQGKPISPVRPRNTRRRSSTTSLDDDINAEQQLLRNLGISLTIEPSNERTIAGILRDALNDRTIKLSGHVRNLQESSETSIASHLHDAHRTFQPLRESLLSETRFGIVRLLDAEIEEAIEKLEVGVEGVKKNIGAVNLEKLWERNMHRDGLIERWSRRESIDRDARDESN